MKLRHCALLLAALPFGALADNAQAPQAAQQVVAFSVEAEKEIPRDLLQATFLVRLEGSDLAKLNSEVNEKVNQALALIKDVPQVTLRSNQRDTQVRYSSSQSKQSGWVAMATLVVESKDFQALGKLIEQLGDTLALENVSATVSKETRQGLENELTQAALAAFQAKAKLIQTNLNMQGYRIVELDISPIQTDFPMAEMGFAPRAMAMKASADANSSFDDSGKQTLKARVNARIALINE